MRITDSHDLRSSARAARTPAFVTGAAVAAVFVTQVTAVPVDAGGMP
ncbi:MAG TPA: hypothetical protein VK936_01975 [Longimicrobiales bacterium]|nr:hypothetical protein [Longimicrobiales bacterium]